MTELPNTSEMIGRTVTDVTETVMIGRDTFKDDVWWTLIRIEFTDGTHYQFADIPIDVYDSRPATPEDEAAWEEGP